MTTVPMTTTHKCEPQVGATVMEAQVGVPEQNATFRHDPYGAAVLPDYYYLAKKVVPATIIIPSPDGGVLIDQCDVGQEIPDRVDRNLNVHLELLSVGSLLPNDVKYVLRSVSQWYGLQIDKFRTTVKTKAFTLSMRFHDDDIVAFRRFTPQGTHLHVAKPAGDALRFSVYYGRRHRDDDAHAEVVCHRPSPARWFFNYWWPPFWGPFSHVGNNNSSDTHRHVFSRNKRTGNPYSNDSVAKRPRVGERVLPSVNPVQE